MPCAITYTVGAVIAIVFLIIILAIAGSHTTPTQLAPYQYIAWKRHDLASTRGVKWNVMDAIAQNHLGMNNAALENVPYIQSVPCKAGGSYKNIQNILKGSHTHCDEKCTCELAKQHVHALNQLSGLPHEEKKLCELTSHKASLAAELVAMGINGDLANDIVKLYCYMVEHNFVLKDGGFRFGDCTTNTIIDDIAFGQHIGTENELAVQVSPKGVHDVLKKTYPNLPQGRLEALQHLFAGVAKNQKAPSKTALRQDRGLLAKQVMAKAHLEDSVGAAFGSSLTENDLAVVGRVASDVLHKLHSFGHVYSSLHVSQYPQVYSSKGPGSGIPESSVDLLASLSADDVQKYAEYEVALASGQTVDMAYASRHAKLKEALSSGKSLSDMASAMGFGHAYTSLHGAPYGVRSRAPGYSDAELVPADLERYAKFEADLAAGRVPASDYVKRHAEIKELLGSSFGHQNTSLHGADYPGVYSSLAPGGSLQSSSVNLGTRLSLHEVERYAQHEKDVAAGRVPDPSYVQRHREIMENMGQAYGHTYTSLQASDYRADARGPGGQVAASSLNLRDGLTTAEAKMYAKFEVDLAAGRVPDPSYVKRHAEIKSALKSLGFGHQNTSLHGADYPGVYSSLAPGGSLRSSSVNLGTRLSLHEVERYAQHEKDAAAGRVPDPSYVQRHREIKESMGQAYGHTYTSLQASDYKADTKGPGGQVAASSLNLRDGLTAAETKRYAQFELDLAAGRVPDPSYVKRHAEIKSALKSLGFGHQNTSLHGADYPGVYSSLAPGGSLRSSSVNLGTRLSLHEVERYAQHEKDVAAGRVRDPSYVRRHREIKESMGQAYGHTYTSLQASDYKADTKGPGGQVAASSLNLRDGLTAAETKRYAQFELDLAAGRVPDPSYVKRHAEIKSALKSLGFGHQNTSLHGAKYPGVFSHLSPGAKLYSSSKSLTARLTPEEARKYAAYEVDLAAGRVPDQLYAQRHAEIKAAMSSGQQFGHQYSSLHGESYPSIFSKRGPGGNVQSATKDLTHGMSLADINRYAKFEVDLAAGRIPDQTYAAQHADIKKAFTRQYNSAFGHTASSLNHALFPSVYEDTPSFVQNPGDLLSQLSESDMKLYREYEDDLAAGRIPPPEYMQRHAEIKASLQSKQELHHATSGAQVSFGLLTPGQIAANSTRPKLTNFGRTTVGNRSLRQALHFGIPLELLQDTPEEHRTPLKQITDDKEDSLHSALMNSKSAKDIEHALHNAFGNLLSHPMKRDLATNHVNTHSTVARCLQENPHATHTCISSALATKTILLGYIIASLVEYMETKLSPTDLKHLATHFSLLYKWV